MADLAITTQIREALAVRLRAISVVNGYRTGAGADVRTEDSQFKPEEGTRITIYPGGKTRPDDAGNKREREFTLVVEALVPTSMATAVTECEAVEADIEQALDGYLQAPMALPLQLTESLFLDKPDGMPAMAAQLMFQTRYR